jgi:hypothetical protein
VSLVSEIDRGSSKHGPRLDQGMAKEVGGLVRSGHSTRAEEWHDPEPPGDEADDQWLRATESPRAHPTYPPNAVISEN